LDSGADDYLVKPFSFAELHARMRALVRRRPIEQPMILEVGDLRIDPRFDLLEHAWDSSYENRSNIVDVYVRYLRRKIERPLGVRSIGDRALRRLPATRRRRLTGQRVVKPGERRL
jgi:two-component system OmpR family response regulator